MSRGDRGTLQAGMVTISLAPFQIPQMVRGIGVSGLSAASPVEMAARNGPVSVAMHALPQNPGPVTVQTAQVIVGLWLQVQGKGFSDCLLVWGFFFIYILKTGKITCEETISS